MSRCLYCYKELDVVEEGDYHPKCIKAFYGTANAPVLPYQLSEMEKLAKESVELSITVPGVQPKLSLGLIKKELQNGLGRQLYSETSKCSIPTNARERASLHEVSSII
jgi:serine/threonine-protein kinase HipA